MSNLEIIELQNAIISNMAQNEKTEQLEEATGNMIGRLKAAGIFEEGGIL